VNPEEFDKNRRACGERYQLIDTDSDQYAHFCFTGNFQQKPVVWDAHLYTLAYYFKQVVVSSQPHPARQFIEVGELTDTGRFISIGLNLPAIDEPAIIKTMIMVRQYKRLASGRYEYGETINLS